MLQHKRIDLTFSRKEEKPFRLDFFHIQTSSWATKEQLDFAWKIATIATLEGWVLKNRQENEESDIIAKYCHSLRFGVDLWKKESSSFFFLPADNVATFDCSFLKSS